MKNITLALCLTLLMAACSSGTSVSDTPAELSGLFRGTFESTTGNESGDVTLNISQNDSGDVSGNIIFEADGTTCLQNGTVEGSVSGFSLALEVEQEITVAADDEDDTAEMLTGTLNIQLTQNGGAGTSLTGTYTVSGNTCSNSTGSGSISLNR